MKFDGRSIKFDGRSIKFDGRSDNKLDIQPSLDNNYSCMVNTQMR